MALPTTPAPSLFRCGTWTVPTWPSRGRPARAKRYVGAHVIGRLVAKAGRWAWWPSRTTWWKTCCAGPSIRPAWTRRVVAKKLAAPHDVPWNLRPTATSPGCWTSPGGCLVGGTAWTMTGKEVPAGSLDLLVIDEAGQFSLANTLAVARAAKRLLLLGDPQQLPQVTQGAHPRAGGRVGPRLAGRRTRHPACRAWATSWPIPGGCIPSCAGRCPGSATTESWSQPRRRRCASWTGLPAGVETVLVEHSGNTTSSRGGSRGDRAAGK